MKLISPIFFGELEEVPVLLTPRGRRRHWSVLSVILGLFSVGGRSAGWRCSTPPHEIISDPLPVPPMLSGVPTPYSHTCGGPAGRKKDEVKPVAPAAFGIATAYKQRKDKDDPVPDDNDSICSESDLPRLLSARPDRQPFENSGASLFLSHAAVSTNVETGPVVPVQLAIAPLAASPVDAAPRPQCSNRPPTPTPLIERRTGSASLHSMATKKSNMDLANRP